MKWYRLCFRFPAVVAGLILLPAALSAQEAVSHVRVVRLSYVSGTVGVRRPDSTEWAKALVNTPIQEGFEISTSANSFAEVEFENGSTARVGELSKVGFSQLALDAEGNKLNRLTFEEGYATFHFLPEHHDTYSVKIADATLTPSGKTEFRTDLRQGRVRVEVFNGSVEVVAPSGSAKVGKDKVLEYSTSTPQEAFNVEHGITKDSWDKWSEARDTQAQLALSDQAVSARGPRYGWSDLDAYGEWAYIPGYGNGWAPFAPLGWSPYSLGMWDFYPGLGLTWISGDPWGWLPYHYGMWNYDASFGWFWMPGSFGAWSPALVSWYAGPGWIGWAPYGFVGPPGMNVVTTVPGSAIQPGHWITPRIVTPVKASAGTKMAQLPIQAGGALAAGATAFTRGVSPAAGTHTVAPTTILMGGDAAKESALLAARHSAHQPLRVQAGTTLGGRFRVGGAGGEFRGDVFAGAGARGLNAPRGPESMHGTGAGPAVLPHAQASASSEERGGGMMPASAGGSSPTPNSAPASSGPASSGHTSTSGGGHH
jgi:hypothetical protein